MKEDKRNINNKSKEICCCSTEKEAILVNRAKLLLKYVLLVNIKKQAVIKQRDVRGRYSNKYDLRS